MNIKKRPNHKLYIQALRRMSPEQRLLKAFELSQFSRDLFLHGLHKRFPNLPEDAINRQGMFNLIDVTSGDKVDFWMLTNEPFDRSRFARKYAEEVWGMRITVSSPEDTILAKLRWAKLSGGSEKQFTDALRVYEVQFRSLDMEYLHSWAKKLDVESMLQKLQEEAEVI